MISVGCFKLGISYAVVTKVKEYTEMKQYGEALDLLEGEDIFQSLNPQFLRCCGKIYLETDHFYESREALIKAHVMAPESIRIIYDLVHLYLKMGYYTRANKYYELYEKLAPADDVGKLYLQYMIKKAQRVEAGELLVILEKACEEEYSDDWGFELSLLYASLGMQSKMKEECMRLMATFRNSPYCFLAESLKKGEYDISNSSFRFPLVEVEEDIETYASVLSIENEQWKQDDLKIHPPAPVILQMEDDDGEEEQEKKKPFPFIFGRKKSKNKEDTGADNQEVKPVAEAQAEQPAQHEEVAYASGDEASDVLSGEAAEQFPNGVAEERASIEENEDNKQTLENESQSIVAPEAFADNVGHTEQDGHAEHGSEDVSSYIESVMKSVADIEASVAEELQKTTSFDTSIHSDVNDNHLSHTEETPKPYQPKLFEVEDSLSPKERLEKLMRLIEEDREKEEEKKENPYQEEELDMDEFLFNLVGANTITQAMVKNYRNEQKDDSE